MSPNMLLYLVFQQTWSSEEIAEEEQHVWTRKAAKFKQHISKLKLKQEHHKLQHKKFIFEILRLKTKGLNPQSSSIKTWNIS